MIFVRKVTTKIFILIFICNKLTFKEKMKSDNYIVENEI